MDKNQLKNFVALAHVLNFSSVAKQQFISQPALTNQISRLEEELGVRLFHRTKHGVSLTYAGSEFYSYAKDILDKMSMAERRMNDISNGCTGFLKISAVTSMEDRIIKYLAEFHRRYDNIKISMESGTGTQQIMAINKKGFDVYFSFSSLLDSCGTLETVPLEDDHYAVYVGAQHGDCIDREDFSWLNCMTLITESRAEGPFLIKQTLSLMEKMNVKTEDIAYYPSTSTILMAVRAGIGYAILPSKMNLGVVPEDILVLPVPGEEAVIQNAMGWHRDSKNVAAQKFVDLVREMEST